MGRTERIARSIVRVLTKRKKTEPTTRGAGQILSFFATLFVLYQLPLYKVDPELFAQLRDESWLIDEDAYLKSFQPDQNNGKEEKAEEVLHPIGDMGYSGSTFFDTKDKKYLVKSIPRPFEHTFFRDDLLEPYGRFMAENPKSLLVRICDFLASPKYPLGAALGAAPTHHIVMENILYGQGATDTEGRKWDNWDLKPQSYFVPERDIADGRLTSEATKSKLADSFDGKIVLSASQAEEFLALLEKDTQLLADCNAVDYSLFLVRITTPEQQTDGAEAENPFVDPATDTAGAAVAPRNKDVIPTSPPFAPPGPPSWRTGMQSPDPRYVWRAVLLDFFWAKHKTQPKVMTFLISAWNACISRQGHMTITTDAKDYRKEFLRMCRDMVEVQAQNDNGSGGS